MQADSRELVSALDRLGVRVSYRYVYGPGTVIPAREAESGDSYLANMIHARELDVGAPQVVYAQGDRFEANSGTYKIGFTMLEIDGLPREWVRQANVMDEVWVPSRFNAGTFRESGVTRPIHVVPLGVDPDHFSPAIAGTPLAGVSTFLSIFEWGERKSRPSHYCARSPAPGRPRTVRSVRALVLRLVRENPGWGYRRVHGELLVLGVKVAASTVWEILQEAGIDPAPERSSATWAGFLRSQAEALLACDFFETVTLSGARLHVLAVIEHASRRIRILGATAHPTASWVTQAARNLVIDLDDVGCRVRFLIRDRDRKFPALFNTVLADAGIETVLSGVRMPRMNSIMERWVQTCRRELLDRTLVWNQSHLLHALREFEQFYNGHRPHQGIADARPLQPLPVPLAAPDQIASLDIRRRDRLGGVLHEYRHAA